MGCQRVLFGAVLVFLYLCLILPIGEIHRKIQLMDRSATSTAIAHVTRVTRGRGFGAAYAFHVPASSSTVYGSGNLDPSEGYALTQGKTDHIRVIYLRERPVVNVPLSDQDNALWSIVGYVIVWFSAFFLTWIFTLMGRKKKEASSNSARSP